MLAYKIEELESDEAEIVSVDCRVCDPDSPRPIVKAKCPVCGGSGKIPSSGNVIAKELRASRLELLKGQATDYDDDLLCM
jgi:RecJ-like exonuclease